MIAECEQPLTVPVDPLPFAMLCLFRNAVPIVTPFIMIVGLYRVVQKMGVGLANKVKTTQTEVTIKQLIFSLV